MKCVCPMGEDRTCPDDCTPARRAQHRKTVAENLYKDGLTMEQIATQLGVDQATISRDLGSLCNVHKPSRPKGGRPKGSKPKPVHHEKIVALADGGLSTKVIAEEVGVSPRMVDRVLEIENVRREAEAQIDPATLSLSAKQKFDAAMRQHRRKLELEFSARVSEEIKRLLDQWLPEYHEKLAEAERALNAYQGLIPRAQFRLVLACLSPDSRKGFSDQKLNEAFNIIKKLEVMLVRKEEQEKAAAPSFQFPRTYEEAMRMKRDVAACRKTRKTNGTNQLA